MSHHAHVAGESRRTRLVALALMAPLALVTVLALVWLWPPQLPRTDSGYAGRDLDGRIVSLQTQDCPEENAGAVNGCGTATVRLGDGSSLVAELLMGPGAPVVHEGDDVVLMSSQYPVAGEVTIVDHQRENGLWLLAIAFSLALIAFGRWRGLTALVGLAVTFVVLLFFIVPAILAGESPLLIAIVGSAAIMLTVLYATHGVALSTTVAVIGTLASFTLTGVLATLAVTGLHLTGVTDDAALTVETTHHIDMAGLLMAGIIIGSLGILDDITVTQAVTVGELAQANPQYGPARLYRAASRVGRSHIASVVNTIVLAYAGASLPLLILTVAYHSSLNQVMTSQFVAQEIVRSVVATLGLIAAVPITTGIAAVVLHRYGGGAAPPGSPAPPEAGPTPPDPV